MKVASDWCTLCLYLNSADKNHRVEKGRQQRRTHKLFSCVCVCLKKKVWLIVASGWIFRWTKCILAAHINHSETSETCRSSGSFSAPRNRRRRMKASSRSVCRRTLCMDFMLPEMLAASSKVSVARMRKYTFQSTWGGAVNEKLAYDSSRRR